MRLRKLLCICPSRSIRLKCRRVRCALLEPVSSYIAERWFIMRLTYSSLFHNTLTSSMTVVDSLLEPMFWFVDRFVRYLGPVSYEFLHVKMNIVFTWHTSCWHTGCYKKVKVWLKVWLTLYWKYFVNFWVYFWLHSVFFEFFLYITHCHLDCLHAS